MATSGWQNEQTVLNRSNWYYNGNIHVSGISHEGTNLHVWGSIAFCPRGSFSKYAYYYDAIYVTPTGGSQTQIVASRARLDSDKYANFDVWIGGVSETTTSYTFGVRFYLKGYMDTTKYWTLNFNASNFNPPIVNYEPGFMDVYPVEVGSDYAVFNATLSSYGVPKTTDGRYIEVDIFGSSNFGSPYRYAVAKNTLSVKGVRVDNSSKTASENPLTIVPNTKYGYGCYATNTALTKSFYSGNITTLPSNITDVTYSMLGDDVEIVIKNGSEGSAEKVWSEYSFNGRVWYRANQKNIALVRLTKPCKMYFRRTSILGSGSVFTKIIKPIRKATLYGSVDNKSKKISNLYGSVGGESKKIKRLYASVNGKSVLIYEE